MACRPPISVTVTWKVNDAPSAPTAGASKVGFAATGSERVTEFTEIVPTCVHIYDAIPSSGSLELDASRVTTASSSAVWSVPASAVGASLTQDTLTTLVSVDFKPPLSVTVSSKVSEILPWSTNGVVKLGVAVFAPDKVTEVWPTSRHIYEAMPSSGSLEFEPSRVTTVPSSTVWLAPASALGASFTQETLTIQVSTSSSASSSVTVSLKVKDTPFRSTVGAVNVGRVAFSSDSVTAGPSICSQ